MLKGNIKLIFFIALVCFFLSAPILRVVAAQITITGTVLGCGDEIIQDGEECDGSNVNSQTCSTKGFTGGSLSCNSDCTFNTGACTSDSSGGGGGGGGGDSIGTEESASQATEGNSSQIGAGFIAVSNTVYDKILKIFQGFVAIFSDEGSQNVFAGQAETSQVASPKAPAQIVQDYIVSASPELSIPEITSYTPETRRGGEFLIKGKTLYPEGKVVVFVLEKKSDTLVTSNITSDRNGDFVFSYKIPSANDSPAAAAVFNVFKRAYTVDVWAMAIDKNGNHSGAGKKVTVSVEEPFFSLDLNMNVMLITILAALSIFLISYIIFNRRRRFIK